VILIELRGNVRCGEYLEGRAKRGKDVEQGKGKREKKILEGGPQPDSCSSALKKCLYL
jgi:hypothetical protein